MLKPVFTDVVLGRAEIRECFHPAGAYRLLDAGSPKVA